MCPGTPRVFIPGRGPAPLLSLEWGQAHTRPIYRPLAPSIFSVSIVFTHLHIHRIVSLPLPTMGKGFYMFTHMLRMRSLVTAATAATALSLVTARASENKAALPTLHEALITSPTGRRYATASPLSGTSWALSFSSQDLRVDDAPSAHSHLFSFDETDGTASMVATIAVDSSTTTSSPRHGLELRQVAVDGGKKLAVEVWLSSGVRLARRVVDGVGPKVLPPGVFGKPQFSSSGSRIAWTAERLPAGTDAVGYWPKAGGAASMSSEPRVLEGIFALSDARTTGEALLVHSSVLVVWDWRTDELAVITPETVLPAGSLPREGVAIAAHPIFDGSDSGLIFGCHLLPPWRPGLSACLNRPTKLFHLSEPLHAARLSKAPAAALAAAPSASLGGPAPMAFCLTPSLYFAHFPRLSPDGRTLAFAARADRFAGHATTVDLRLMAWPPASLERPTDDQATLATLSPDSKVLLHAEAKVDVAAAGAGEAFGGWSGFHDELASLTWQNSGTVVCHEETRSPYVFAFALGYDVCDFESRPCFSSLQRSLARGRPCTSCGCPPPKLTTRPPQPPSGPTTPRSCRPPCVPPAGTVALSRCSGSADRPLSSSVRRCARRPPCGHAGRLRKGTTGRSSLIPLLN